MAFSTSAPERARETVNFQLPPDLWCTAWAEVAPEFHPRYDARSRTYRYYFSECPEATGEMSAACRLFLGTHDFSRFARVRDKNPERTILAIRIAEEDGFTFLEVKAESFLWHQVRCMATALLRIGAGQAGEESIPYYLNGGNEHPPPPAPAEGLVLWDTDCGVTWLPLQEGGRSCQFIEHLGRHHALMEKVCRVLKE